MADDGGGFSSTPFDSPGNHPLEDDENAHVPESAKEEDLLRQPFEKEIDVVFEVQSIKHLQEDR